MTDCVAFLELLAQLERDGRETEWREMWAGMLVMRLYRLWMIESAITCSDATAARRARDVVASLPETTETKAHLSRIVAALRCARVVHRDAIARHVAEYASALAGQGRWPLAHDVYRLCGARPVAVLLAD